MSFPVPGRLEMNLTDGSSCPTYVPLSWNRPPQVPRGSVQRPPRSTLTSLYLVLCPLQSSMFTGFGATAVLAPDAAVRLEAALAAMLVPVAVPTMTINDPPTAHSRAHRLPIVVLPPGLENAPSTCERLWQGPGPGSCAAAQSSSRELCLTS